MKSRGPGEGYHLLSEEEGLVLLKEYGVRVPGFSTADSRESAGRVAERIGFPVVMKVISPQVVHKTDAGGVVRGICTRSMAEDAYDAIIAGVRNKVPEAEIRGVMVEEECPAGLELLVGGRTDPAFGKVLTFGMGGTMVEILRDVAIRVLPVERREFEKMVREIRGYALIRGFRGGAPLDEEALLDALEDVAEMFLSHPEISEFDINPLILYEKGFAAVDARVYTGGGHTAGAAPPALSDFSVFYPRSIAVVGASADPRKIGYAVLRNLLSFPGEIYPINSHEKEILGKTVYPRISDVPGEVDVVVIAIPAPAVPGVIEESADFGVRLAIVLASGFRESGEEGKELESRILAIAGRSGMRIVGPNCLGIIVPYNRINTTFDPISPRPGHIGFISQSGAVITTIVDWSIPEEIGFSMVISVGNQVDLGFIDFIRVVAADVHTRAIILYIEEIRDGSAFLEAVAAVSRNRPVIALKSGSSETGARAASSHTGSLAGSFEVYQAAFRQAGVISVFSLQEAFDVAELLVSEGYPHGNRAMVITAAGGFAVLASDYAERFGITMPPLSPALRAALDAILPPIWSRNNPMDIIGDGGAERYARVFDVMTRFQDEWDIAVVIAVPSALLDPKQLGQEIARFSRVTHKMVVGCLLGGDSMKGGIRVLREHHVPNYSEIQSAFLAVGRTLAALKKD